MSGQTPESPEIETSARTLAVRWDAADLERLERAAALLSEREHFRVTVTDVIRRGTRRELEAIEKEAAAAEASAS